MNEMHEKSDAQLLRDYADRGNEAAFREIVMRHTDLVYSAALRRVNSSDLAGDIAQSVFTDLSRKARPLADKLADNASLVGWLYRSTRFAALSQLRPHRRRFAHERQAMEQLLTNSETAPGWDRIRPLLDEAMDNLGDEDRDALLLRYFKNHDFRAVGLALGVSDDAAQKRVSRAVERLREFFAKRGVTVGASGLVVVISANAVQAAPVGLAVTISTAAALAGTTIAASTATITALKLMSTATLKPIIVASATIAASIVIVVQHNRADRLREQNESLQAQVQKAETASAKLSERLQTLARVQENDPRQAELLRLRGEATRLRGLEAELAKLREESLRQQEQSRAASAAEAAPRNVDHSRPAGTAAHNAGMNENQPVVPGPRSVRRGRHLPGGFLVGQPFQIFLGP